MSRPVDVGGFKPPPKPKPGKVISVEGGVPSYSAPPSPVGVHGSTGPQPASPPAHHGGAISVEGGVPSYQAPAPNRSNTEGKAILAVFGHQAPSTQAKIALRALKQRSAAGDLILNQLRAESKLLSNPSGLSGLGAVPAPALSSLPASVRALIPKAQVYTSLIARGAAPPGVGTEEGPLLKAAMHAVFQAQPTARKERLMASATKLGIVPKSGNFWDALNFTAQRVVAPVAGALAQFRNQTTPGGGQSIATIQGGAVAGKFGANAAKDLLSLPATAVTSIGQVASDAVTKGPGQGAKDFYQPFVNLAEHPGQSLLQHPVNSALMFMGALHGGSRLAAAPVRALASEDSALGRAVSTKREPVQLTANLQEDRVPYSKSPTVKYLYQRGPEKAKFTRDQQGNLTYRNPNDRAMAIRRVLAAEHDYHERLRRADNSTVLHTRENSVLAPRVKRAADSVKKTLAKAPRRLFIPGADVLKLIAQHTIRRPETFFADLQKHIDSVAKTRPDLLGWDAGLKAHDAYIAALKKVADDRRLRKPGAIDKLFKAADQYNRGYPVTQQRAFEVGVFGKLDKAQLERAVLGKYAIDHMGAKYHPKDEALTIPGRFGDRQLTNAEIRAHMNGPEGSGGRPIAFTTDRIRGHAEEQSAPVTTRYAGEGAKTIDLTRNSYFAHTHGLTDPTHMALTEQHVFLQELVSATERQNAIDHLLAVTRQRKGAHDLGTWNSFKEAEQVSTREFGGKLKPFKLAEPLQSGELLAKRMQHVDPATIAEEAQRLGLSFSDRMKDDGSRGRWALVDPYAAKIADRMRNPAPKSEILRAFRGLTNQFRTVALTQSMKHIPGVIQENLIRDIGFGVGPRSWLAGHMAFRRAPHLFGSEQARRAYIRLISGGQQAGLIEAMRTHSVSEYYHGTHLYRPMKAWENFVKYPGPRQLRTAWLAYSHTAIGLTKHILEQEHLKAGIGKQLLAEHGYVEAAKVNGIVGVMQRMFGLYGKMLDDATRNMVDPAKQRQMAALNRRMYGNWTALTPSGRALVMTTPFGLWWWNSAKFIARMPVDMPVKTGVLAAANTSTQKARYKEGADPFAPHALPLYEMGGIVSGSTDYAQNYYTPAGIANDPLATGESLFVPWLTPILDAAKNTDYLGRQITSPENPHGRSGTLSSMQQLGQDSQYIINSWLSDFVPLYQKFATIAAGGASPYDVTGTSPIPPLLRGQLPGTKTPRGGVGAGVKKALNPLRAYHIKGNGSSDGGYSSGGYSSGGYSSGGYSSSGYSK